MTLTQFHNLLFYWFALLIAVVAALPPEVLPIVPASAKPYVVAAIMVAGTIKAHLNYGKNPDGTPASEPYQPPPAAPPKPDV